MKIIDTRPLFGDVTEKLLLLLNSLTEEQWYCSTCYPDWKVKDIVAHLLQTGISRLSIQRDAIFKGNEQRSISFSDLSEMIDQNNSIWSDAFSTVSPRVLMDLVTTIEQQLAEYIRTQDLMIDACFPVTWSGQNISENWFDIAREYTERWHHQQQIREAVQAPSLYEKKYFQPVIHTLIHAVPYWYSDQQADNGTRISIRINGESGGNWILIRQMDSWQLNEDDRSLNTQNVIELSEDIAWRFLTRSIPVIEAENKIKFSDDSELLRHFLKVRAIMIDD